MKNALRSKLAAFGLVLVALGAAHAAHAADVYFSIGTPTIAAPVYVAPAAPVYAPQPVYVQPAPVYVVPPYGPTSNFERAQAWRAAQWRHWHERQERWREWHRWHDDD